MSGVELLHMAFHIPFNHGPPIGYAIIRNAMAAHAIDTLSIFAGEGDNSHEWLDTPFFHIWAEVMSSGGKNISLCCGQSTNYDCEPPTSQGTRPLTSAALLLLETVAQSLGPRI
jgi:hypothetical protein